MRQPDGPRATLAVLALILSLGGWLWAARSPAASAASTSQITIAPSSGPVGTAVHVTITPAPTTTASAAYTLGTTTTQPTGPTCADSQPIPGLAPVTVGPSGGQVDFNWPAALGGGPYWLCASPADGAGSGLPSYRSYQPFTVLASGAPTPTATQPQAAATAAIAVPAGGIQPGAPLTVLVSNWHSRAGTPPTAAGLDVYDPAGAPTDERSLSFSIASQDGAGRYSLSVTLPPQILPQTYWIRISDAATAVYTQSFTIAATPTPAVPASRPPAGDAAGQIPTTTLIAAGLAALLVVFIGIFAAGRLRR